MLGWLSILETVGSYFKEGNGIKYRNKKRSIGRYQNRTEGDWQLERFGSDQRSFVLTAVTKKLNLMIADTAMWEGGAWENQKIVEGSAFNLSKICHRRKFDSIVFSPPYANRFDYFESSKVELWFGCFVKSYSDLSQLRKASMRSHLGADLNRPAMLIEPLEELIALMDQNASSWRMGVPDLLRGYFHDLHDVLVQCRELTPKGRCFVVVGNSAFAGVVIPTDVFTATLAKSAGFRSATIAQTRHLTVSPQQRARLSGFEPFMRESVIVLD